MRILMLSPSPTRSGGVIDFVRMLGANLSSGFELQTVSVGDDDSRLPMPLRMLRDGWQLLKLIRRLRPDLIHLNPSLDRAIVRDGFYLLLSKLVHRGAVVVFIHGWNAHWESRIDKSSLLKALFRMVFGSADRVYVLATRFRQTLARWGLEPDRLRVTSTMYDPSQFEGMARRRPSPATANGLQILFMSRLVRDKGASETIEAFADVATATPGLRLVCAGDGPERAALERLAATRGVSANVDFPGFVRGSEKAQLMLDSDLFVFPTRYGEGCPVSLLEAMAAGLPVITADAGGIADVFRDGVNGVLLNARPDGNAVAAAIDKMIGDVQALRRIGDANHEVAASRYEAGTWCRALESDYAAMGAARTSSAHA